MKGHRARRVSHEMLLKESYILEAVCIRFNCTIADIKSSTRGTERIARARMCVAYILHTSLQYTLTNTGRVIGRDRTTVRHACNVIEDLREINNPIDVWLQTVEEILN